MAIHDPSYLDIVLEYGLDPRARRIVLHGDLEFENDHGKNPSQIVTRSLLYLDQTVGKIELWICTDGGFISEMFGLHDIIRTRKSEVSTIGFGLVASAGLLLLASGDKRKATKNCWAMSHSDQVESYGELWTMDQRMEWNKKCSERWASLMAAHSNKPRVFWSNLHKGKTRELWLDAKEMLSYGIIDEIIEEPDAN